MRWHFVLALAARTSKHRLRAEAQGYDYTQHGEDWIGGTCSSRERQSPIDFSSELFHEPPTGTIFFNYQPVSSSFEIANTGNSLFADFAGLGYGGLSYDSHWYNLFNINIHAESEHTFSGVHKPLELHMVHKRFDSAALIVVAVMIDALPPIGPRNATPVVDPGEQFFNPTLAFLTRQPPVINQRVVSMASDLNQLDLNDFVEGGTFFSYFGSLTAPPCSETVTWFVRREPIMASTNQYLLLHDALYESTAGFGNARTTMPVNGRTISVAAAKREKPPPEQPIPGIPLGPNPRADRQQQASEWSREALEVATGATNYVKSLDERLRAAAYAHVMHLAPDLTATTPMPIIPELSPADIKKAMAHVAQSIADSATDAVAEAKAQIARESRDIGAAEVDGAMKIISAMTAAPPPQANGTNATAFLQVRVEDRRLLSRARFRHSTKL
jgi:carbonic anhydrase